VPQPDPCTLALLTEIQQRGWKLRSSQFGIFDESIGVATAIDLLAETADGRLILLEQKVTKHRHCNYYEHARGYFRHPLQNVPFSLFNVDLLQLLVMALMLHYSYGVTVDEAYLVRVGHGQIWIYGLSDWCITQGHRLYTVLQQRELRKRVAGGKRIVQGRRRNQ
jgi:hypothetical protein